MLLKFNIVPFVGSNELLLGMCCWDMLSFRFRGSGKTNLGRPIVLVISTLVRFLVEWSILLVTIHTVTHLDSDSLYFIDVHIFLVGK